MLSSLTRITYYVNGGEAIRNLWRKFHFIAEILCQSDNKRELLERAALEIERIDIVNVPYKYAEQIQRIKDSLSLPKNVHVLSNITHARYVIRTLSDDEADNLMYMIFELEARLNPNNFAKNKQ